jgi:hypothetical protein
MPTKPVIIGEWKTHTVAIDDDRAFFRLTKP